MIYTLQDQQPAEAGRCGPAQTLGTYLPQGIYGAWLLFWQDDLHGRALSEHACAGRVGLEGLRSGSELHKQIEKEDLLFDLGISFVPHKLFVRFRA